MGKGIKTGANFNLGKKLPEDHFCYVTSPESLCVELKY